MSSSHHVLPFTTRLLYVVEEITLEEYQRTIAGQQKAPEKSEPKNLDTPSLEFKPTRTSIVG